MTVNVPYFPLHSHSSFSSRDGFGLPNQVAERLITIGQSGCAITDHGTLFGLIPFWSEFSKRNLKLVCGCEFYQCASITDKDSPVASKEERKAKAKAHHLTVLAQTQTGYRNLLKLFEISYRDGFSRYPRIDWSVLAKYQEGLIVLSGCLGGRISQRIVQGQEDVAFEMVRWAKDNFENFFIEILPCPGIQDSAWACSRLWEMAKELNIPTVITDDAHFPRPEDHAAQEAMLCANYKYKLRPTDPREREYRIARYHHHCNGEIILARAKEVLPHIPEADLIAACVRSVEIANSCQVELPRSSGPKVAVPEGKTPLSVLKEKVQEGKAYRRRLGLLPAKDSPEWQTYLKREEYELSIVAHHRFESYFLLVADIVEWSKSQNYWCIARGSAGGSLLCYYLQISQIDPIKLKLPVERFIDFSRADMPDIDLDFDARYRDKVFRYLEEKYGREHCAQIAALSTYRARQSLRDIGEVCEIPLPVIQELVRLLPELDDEGEGIKATGHLARLFNTHPKAQQLVQQYPDLWLAAGIEGQLRAQSVHAAGVVVDSNVLSEVVGIIEQPGKGRVVACDKDYAAQQGLLKIDALSVEMLSAIAETVESIGKDIDWLYQMPLDDPETYALLSKGRNMGIFQMKGHTAGRLLPQLQPTEFNDLVALAALGRPGPLQSGGTQDYIDRKHGRQPVPDFHPLIKEVLSDTYGVVIYQEQVMEAATKVGGLSVADAHKIRKLVSKSGGSAALEKYKEPYLKGAQERGVPLGQALCVWEMCQEAGDYVFNKAHGADYALLGYWTAYLKCHYPSEFIVACANHEKKEEFRNPLLQEFRSNGGRLILLDPNRSQERFSSPERGVIVGGFANFKGIGDAMARQIIAGRPYRDWLDFMNRCPSVLADMVKAIGLHKGEIDLDVALALAPWYVEVTYSAFEHKAFERLKAVSIQEALRRLEHGCGSRALTLLGRVTGINESVGKKGKNVTLTLSDPTGSLDVYFAAWRWKDVEPLQQPLTGPLAGIGNVLALTASIAGDYSRIFGENAVKVKESKGYLPESVRRALEATQKGETVYQAALDFETGYTSGVN